ncbi:MAG: Flagellar hook-length control protein FliK [Labilithrix sp.]|nr:Flagellar hook-length control protein FliK [Labilithrix sp.]
MVSRSRLGVRFARIAALVVALLVAGAWGSMGCTSILGDFTIADADDGGGSSEAASGSPIAASCTTDTDCASRHCADGVCCDTACTGMCESCGLEAKGTCSPIAADTDPEHECANVGPADGGGVQPPRDGGTEGGLTFPDGGGLNLSACAGVCNGNRACNYPSATIGCGPTFCQAPTKSTTFHCDGKGGCALQSSTCNDFVCESGSCRTNCAGNDDCQPTNYCNANGQCVPKKQNGVSCAVTAECKSGYCVAGPNARVCCNSSCNDTGMQCDIASKEGSCSCGSLACPNGCRLFYVDNDGDKHGDGTGTLANQRAVAGCIGATSMTGPIAGKAYLPSDDDCDDLDPNAFPGQTAFFDTANPRIGFDYNCSKGSIEKELPEWPGLTCQVCTLYYPNPSTPTCQGFSTCANQCCNRASSAGFRCGFACPNGGGGFECCPLPGDPAGSTQGFEQTVGCGAQAPYHVCGVCNMNPTNTSNTPVDGIVGNKTQRCH